MQGKCRVKDVDRVRRKKPPVEGTGNSGGKIRPVVVGGEALFHASTAGVGWQELKESVEVVAREIGEESRELGRFLETRRLVALDHVLHDRVDDADRVVPAGTPEIGHGEWDLRRVQLNAV